MVGICKENEEESQEYNGEIQEIKRSSKKHETTLKEDDGS